MKNLIYVTSFSPDLYQATGRNLLDSYRRLAIPEPLVVCYERQHKPMPPMPGVEIYDLDKDKFLQNWLRDNRDIIPQHLGGTTKQCKCPGSREMHATHKRGCYWAWMNRNMSRWFRKVVSWRHAITLNARMVVWLDCDTAFKERPTEETVESWFGSADVFYCRGKREAIESGLLGFKPGGWPLVDDVCDYYESKAFRKEERWDDGYILTRRVAEGRVLARDIVDQSAQITNEAVPYTPAHKYVSHFKGMHGRRLKVMI